MVKYIDAKSILSELKGKDEFFGIRYNMNLYRGCQHGCIYCDTRSECYGIGDIGLITVKRNALALLARELIAKRVRKATIGTGSMNDPYMPLEKRLQMTCRALELIAGARFPVHVITKSDLVARDIDILQEANRTYAAVSFTVTTADDCLSRIIEPAAPVSSRRFRAMELLSRAGIYTGVTFMPLLPFIDDTEENVREVVRRAAGSGASYVIPMFGVTLRRGSRDYFYGRLDRHFPGYRNLYEATYADNYECISPAYRRLYDVFREESEKWGLASRMRFYEPPCDVQPTLF